MILLKTFSLVYFQYLCLLELFAFAYLLILSGLKVKIYFKKNLKINILIIKITRALTEFCMLTIVINCVIEKDGKYYPEIYLDGCLYDKV